MKIEVGMYVRTDEGIRKIIEDYDEGYELDKSLHYLYPEGHDLYKDDLEELDIKVSHNIIDLIEVGDVITTNNLCGEVTHIEGDKIYTTCYDGEYCYDYQIQSILTREQFKSMSYKVGK